MLDAGFVRIALKVIFQGLKRKKGQIWQFPKKWSDNFVMYCIQLLGDDIDQLSRDGFYLVV